MRIESLPEPWSANPWGSRLDCPRAGERVDRCRQPELGGLRVSRLVQCEAK